MRKSIWITCAVILAICAWLLLHRSIKQEKNVSSSAGVMPTNQPSAEVANQPKPSEAPAKPPNPQASIAGTVSPRPAGGIELSNWLFRQMQADWQKPIEFYGRVLDENTNPVAGAGIRFQWADMTENVAANTSTTESDTEGLFSLHGKLGRSLEVYVGKEGYYASHGGYKGFLYSLGNDIYSPDPQNPVIFLLHKKGQGVKLITSDNGTRSDLAIRVPKDGTPGRVDFPQNQIGATGQLEISQNKPPWQGATNWSFSLSIPDGGLIENQDEFQFQAPDTGYQPKIEYNFAKSEPDWTTHVTKQFYIAFGQPRKYGWLRFESDISQETVFVTYAINPTGSQNLEPSN